MGIRAFVVKAFAIRDFAEIVRRVLDNSQACRFQGFLAHGGLASYRQDTLTRRREGANRFSITFAPSHLRVKTQ